MDTVLPWFYIANLSLLVLYPATRQATMTLHSIPDYSPQFHSETLHFNAIQKKKKNIGPPDLS